MQITFSYCGHHFENSYSKSTDTIFLDEVFIARVKDKRWRVKRQCSESEKWTCTCIVLQGNYLWIFNKKSDSYDFSICLPIQGISTGHWITLCRKDLSFNLSNTPEFKITHHSQVKIPSDLFWSDGGGCHWRSLCGASGLFQRAPLVSSKHDSVH